MASNGDMPTSKLAWDALWDQYPAKRSRLLTVASKAVGLGPIGLDLVEMRIDEILEQMTGRMEEQK